MNYHPRDNGPNNVFRNRKPISKEIGLQSAVVERPPQRFAVIHIRHANAADMQWTYTCPIQNVNNGLPIIMSTVARRLFTAAPVVLSMYSTAMLADDDNWSQEGLSSHT